MRLAETKPYFPILHCGFTSTVVCNLAKSNGEIHCKEKQTQLNYKPRKCPNLVTEAVQLKCGSCVACCTTTTTTTTTTE